MKLSPEMSLLEYLNDVLALEVSISPNTVEQYYYSVHALNKFHGGMVRLCDLSEPLLNKFIIARQAGGAAPKTVRNDRVNLLRIWSHAEDNPDVEVIELRRRKIRQVKLPRHAPVGFLHEDVKKFLDACKRFRGRWKRVYWLAWINAAYETGMRRGDLFALRQDEIDESGLVTHTMAKTGDSLTVRLSVKTLVRLRRLPSPCPLAYPSTIRAWQHDYRQLKKWAGVKNFRGFAQPLRRTAASYLERDHPGMGARLLGHRTPGMFERHYKVPRIVQAAIPPLPPALPAEGDEKGGGA